MELLYVSHKDGSNIYLAEGMNGKYNIFDSAQALIDTTEDLSNYKIECDVNELLDNLKERIC